MPVLNIFANDDHIVPPAMTRNVGGRFATKDYTELALPAGHMGVFVSGKTQGILGEHIVKWLAERPSGTKSRNSSSARIDRA